MDELDDAAVTRAEEFAARVEQALADLPREQRARLTQGLAAHLAERGTGGVAVVDELGSAQAYADELRATLPDTTEPAGQTGSRRRGVFVVAGVVLLVLVLPALLGLGALLGFRVFTDSPSSQQPSPVSPAGSAPTATSPAPVTIVLVPNVLGLTVQRATSQIQNAGLRLGSVTTAPSGTAPNGVVISMAPAAGSQVTLGSLINLTVSSGP
jgi:hypothetical protein